jgi:hypothetical protein
MTNANDRVQGVSPRPKSRFKFFALLAIGILVGGFLLLAGTGTAYYLMSKELPLKPSDMAAMVTVEEFAEAVGVDVPVDEAAVQVSKRRFPFGEMEWTYLYEVEGAPIFVSCEVHRELSSEDAALAMDLTQKAMAWGLTDDCQLQACDHLLRWGDESSASWLMVEGQAVGNLFRARKGSLHLSLVMVGGVFEDPAAFAAFLGPKLEAAANLSAD